MTRESHDRNEWVDEPTDSYPTPEAKAKALRRTALGCLIGWCIGFFVVLWIIAAMGCQASTTIKGGHSEASSTTTSTNLRITPTTKPAEPARTVRVQITPVKEPACSSPPAAHSSSGSPSASTPSSPGPPPTAKIVPRATTPSNPLQP